MDGRSPATAWRTLERAGSLDYGKGDQLLLRRGCVFPGKLSLTAAGTEDAPVIVGAYDGPDGDSARPVIDAKGFVAGVHLDGGRHVEIANLEITADGGEPKERDARTQRYGVWVTAGAGTESRGVRLRNLLIRDIFASKSVEHEGKNPTSNMGRGIELTTRGANGFIRGVTLEDCRIERTGHIGIKISGAAAGDESSISDIAILRCTTLHTGGSGIQPGRVSGMIVRGNTVERSGSFIDPRMHGRGSGMWPWSCRDVLIEHNRFLHARGKADSCGIHIDFNCSDIVVQYNLSVDNEGGFAEILGNCRNCAYRYNVSVNDGFRIKGVDGATQEGKIIWLSGFTGKAPRAGPFNSYIYNNTIYVRGDIRAGFAIARTTDGALIANNIFHIPGSTAAVADDQKKKFIDPGAHPVNIVFTNNLYVRQSTIPPELLIQDTGALVGHPAFRNPGGTKPEDYKPVNAGIVKGRGIPILPLPGDEIGLRVGLRVERDILGALVGDRPGLGAIETD